MPFLWPLIYTEKDLTSDLQNLKTGRKNNGFRFLLLLLSSVGIITTVYNYNLYRLFQYFTNWTQVATFLQVLLGIVGSYKDLGYGVLAGHHVLFEAATLMNIITVTVYWSLLHDESY